MGVDSPLWTEIPGLSDCRSCANELTVITNPSGVPTSQSFDANGNLTGINTGGALTTQFWDSENRLLTVSDATGITTNTYAADGLRQRKIVGATTSNFLWDASNLAQESNASLVVQARNTDLPGIWGGKFSQHRGGPSKRRLGPMLQDCCSRTLHSALQDVVALAQTIAQEVCWTPRGCVRDGRCLINQVPTARPIQYDQHEYRYQD